MESSYCMKLHLNKKPGFFRHFHLRKRTHMSEGGAGLLLNYDSLQHIPPHSIKHGETQFGSDKIFPKESKTQATRSRLCSSAYEKCRAKAFQKDTKYAQQEHNSTYG